MYERPINQTESANLKEIDISKLRDDERECLDCGEAQFVCRCHPGEG